MSPRWTSLSAIVAALSFAFVGCNRPTLPSVGSAAPRIVESGPPVTEKEAEEYGQKVAAAFNAQDANELGALIQIDELCKRSLSDFNLTPAEWKSVADALGKNGGGVRMCQSWMTQMKGTEVKHLRTRVKDGRQNVLLRVCSDEGGLNYLEFTIARGESGRVTTEDVYIYSLGETLTQVLRRIILAMMPLKDGGQGQTRLYETHTPEVRQIQTHINAGELAKAKAIYDGLPAALRDQKSIHIQGLLASQGSDADYLRELDRYRKNHPNDPSLDLLLVYYHILKKDAKALRECLWRLDEAVGGDPMLRLVDANYHLEQGNYAEARRLASEVVKLEPTFQSSYFVLIDVALAEDNHAETLRLLKAVVEKCNFQLDPASLRDVDVYKRFVMTKEYRELVEWMEQRPK